MQLEVRMLMVRRNSGVLGGGVLHLIRIKISCNADTNACSNAVDIGSTQRCRYMPQMPGKQPVHEYREECKPSILYHSWLSGKYLPKNWCRLPKRSMHSL